MQHQLNKLQFEATCATEAQAFHMRHYFSQACQGALADTMDKVCTQYVNEEEWIQIDKIEIDLGNLNMQSPGDDFMKILTQKFETALAGKITQVPVAEKQASKQTAYFKMLVHFLQTGTLPWWAGNEITNIELIFDAILAEQPKLLGDFLQQQQLIPAVWQRIAMQCSDKEYGQIILLLPQLSLAEERMTRWVKYMALQKNIIFIETFVTAIRRFILENALQFFVAAKETAPPLQVLQEMAGRFATIAGIAENENEMAQMITDYAKAIPAGEDNAANANESGVAMTAGATIGSIEEPATEKYIVYSAGIVLLAPFFKQLFKQLNLIDQGMWVSNEAHYKAIHLARYMATGELMCPEHLLVLEKLLCGMPVTAPIPREVILSEAEKAEATAVLTSVIAHWEKLKNTSVEGLRQTFLKREGLLTKKENGWLLQVERKTVDVLLDSIPWGYSTLAFTWNSYIIFAEW